MTKAELCQANSHKEVWMSNAMFMDLYGNYRTRTFADIFEDEDNFEIELQSTVFRDCISENSRKLLFSLLYAQYGNSHIANADENQFKYRVFSTIFMYGPTWEKRLELQKNIRELDYEVIKEGGKVIYNHALNPGTAPDTQSLEELQYINDQNTTNYKKSDLEAYALVWDMLATDVSKEFLNHFRKLFITIVEPECPLWYSTDTEVEDGNGN